MIKLVQLNETVAINPMYIVRVVGFGPVKNEDSPMAGRSGVTIQMEGDGSDSYGTINGIRIWDLTVAEVLELIQPRVTRGRPAVEINRTNPEEFNQ